MGSYILPSGGIQYLKQIYPGWGILIEKLSDRNLTAKDLKITLGISYRQLNDWEKRGIIKSILDRPFVKKAEGWRKFSIIDLIYFGILVNLKKQGIPVSKLTTTIETLRLNENLYDFIPNIVFRKNIYFYTNLETWTGYQIIDENESFEIDHQILNENDVILILPLNKIIDDILFKVKIKDFKIIKNNEDGSKNFIINNVPLSLEKLPEK